MGLPAPRLVLASASPARLATLRAAGLHPEVMVSDVDEDGIEAATPAGTALLLAGMKAAAVAALIESPGVLVLGCDSLLELDGRAYGKPHTAEEAARRWRSMRGRSGVLHTGHCLIRTGGLIRTIGRTADPRVGGTAGQGEPNGTNNLLEAVASTTVRFAALTDSEINAYIRTGEPLVVAGAFTLDGFGGAFVEEISGDHHNVVGVSLPLVRRMMIDLGIDWPRLWAPSS